jgi:hypothetical protein
MLSFNTNVRGLLTPTASRPGSPRRKGSPRPALESLKERVLTCIGRGCNWHASPLVQNVKPSSLTTAAEVTHIGGLKQGFQFHRTNANTSGLTEDLISQHEQTIDECGCVSVHAVVAPGATRTSLRATRSPRPALLLSAV